MDLWNDIVTTAALGTERRAFVPSADEQLGALLARIDPAEHEGALLAAAAAVALYRRAGRLPASATWPAAPECVLDDMPACTPHAERRLATMLEGTNRALLPEWLAALAAAQRHAPHALLPELLELGRTHADLRAAILPVMGARGRWLAAQNPDWSYAGLRAESLELGASEQELGDSAEKLKAQNAQLIAAWETGSQAARLTLLQEVRSAAPAHARGMIAATWAGEKADDRAAFLEIFAVGLSIDDQPLLEEALDDRSKEVRRIAAALLARLPESRLAERLLERMGPVLAWIPAEKPRLLGLRPGQPARIDLTLPKACDKAMARDGVEPKPPRGRSFGERAWWAVQMIACIPPSHWSQIWRASPAEIVAATIASEWQHELLFAWVNATRNHADANWAEALLSAWAYPSSSFNPALLTEFVEPLLKILPYARRQAFVIEHIQKNSLAIQVDSIVAMLRACGPRWSTELSRIVLDQLRRATQEQKNITWNVNAGFQEFALYMAPELSQAAAAAWPQTEQLRWQAAIDAFLIKLQFRRDMLSELREG
jgi:hypothetical protein